MIKVEGYKAFHGNMLITPASGAPSFVICGDWLYKPDTDCWYGAGQSFPADVCKIVAEL